MRGLVKNDDKQVEKVRFFVSQHLWVIPKIDEYLWNPRKTDPWSLFIHCNVIIL
jgi:hypothetical protein